MELSGKDKKAARAIIEKGLQTEFAKALNQAWAILGDWKNRQSENRVAYHALFKHIYDADQHIARRYDRMTGSAYVHIVAAQLADCVILPDDLKDLSEEVVQAIRMLSGR